MDILAMLLGIEEDDADQVRKVVHSLSDDLPQLLTRVEEVEILVKAQSLFMREQDPMLWAKSLKEAKEKVERQNAQIRTTVRK